MNASVQDGEQGRLQAGRYLIATLFCALWVMVFALHVPVRSIAPRLECFFYPGFMFFLPLSVFYGKLFPWPPTDVRALLGMSAMDVALMAALCLPFLYPKGRKQDALSVVSLAALAVYTIGALYSFLARAY
ncbi:MAG: hypothetical protein QME60_02755 [Verrucomicrobiota bacterium]|nr:hypothetical protein [Verrucomicrobiota bacterium]